MRISLEIDVLPWLAYTSNFNRTENVWDQLSRAAYYNGKQINKSCLQEGAIVFA